MPFQRLNGIPRVRSLIASVLPTLPSYYLYHRWFNNSAALDSFGAKGETGYNAGMCVLSKFKSVWFILITDHQ